MTTVSPDREFQSPVVSSMIQASDSSLSNRTRSESLPPTIVTRGESDTSLQHSHFEDITPLDITTNEYKNPTLISRPNNVRSSKNSSHSFTSMKTVDELDQEDQKRKNDQSVKANVTRVRRFPSHHVPWIKEDSTESPSQRSRSESLPPTPPVAGGHGRIPLKHVTPLHTMVNDRQESTSNGYPDDVRSARLSSLSFSSLKTVDEKEERDQSAKNNRPKRNSIYSLVQVGKPESANIIGNKTNSPRKYLPAGDLTPLDPITDKNQKSKINSHLVKYNFQSSNSTTNIYGKQEETAQPSDKNRRQDTAFNWRKSDCFKALGCLFAMTACSIGIAALVFAIISYRTTLPGTTITTTSTTTTMSTTTTTTTTTTTSTQTTTASTTVTTTTTTTSTTSTTSTSATTICSTTTMTTVVTATPLPSECFAYMNINDPTRQSNNNTGSTTGCDQTLFPTKTWVRFTGAAGVSLANCPITLYYCGTSVTGWYSGIYPSVAGNTTEGVVCYNWAQNTCSWQTIIQITNCNGYYVYELSAPPTCNARYCTI